MKVGGERAAVGTVFEMEVGWGDGGRKWKTG